MGSAVYGGPSTIFILFRLMFQVAEAHLLTFSIFTPSVVFCSARSMREAVGSSTHHLPGKSASHPYGMVSPFPTNEITNHIKIESGIKFKSIDNYEIRTFKTIKLESFEKV
jgi:hypothetical protein